MNIIRAAVVLLQIVAWLIEESVKRQGAEETKKQLGEQYARQLEEVLAKAERARADSPAINDPGLFDNDGFRRD